MPSDADSNDAYEVVLADLKSRRAQIDQAITAIEALRSGAAANAGPAQTATASQEIRPGAFLGMTIIEAAKAVLAIKREPLSPQEIADLILRGGVVMTAANASNTVGATLNRHKNGGEVVNVARGKWGLASWFRNPGRFQKRTEGGEKPMSEPGGEEGVQAVQSNHETPSHEQPIEGME